MYDPVAVLANTFRDIEYRFEQFHLQLMASAASVLEKAYDPDVDRMLTFLNREAEQVSAKSRDIVGMLDEMRKETTRIDEMIAQTFRK